MKKIPLLLLSSFMALSTFVSPASARKPARDYKELEKEILALSRSGRKDLPQLCEPAFGILRSTCESLFGLPPRCFGCCVKQAKEQFQDMERSSLTLCKLAVNAKEAKKQHDDEVWASNDEMQKFANELPKTDIESCNDLISLINLKSAEEWIDDAGQFFSATARDREFFQFKVLKYRLCRAQMNEHIVIETEEEKEQRLYCGNQNPNCVAFCKLSQSACENNLDGVWNAPSKCTPRDKARFMETGLTHFKKCEESLGLTKHKEEL